LVIKLDFYKPTLEKVHPPIALAVLQQMQICQLHLFIHAFDPNNVAISSLEIVLQVLFATL
jgi:hypothetical protein